MRIENRTLLGALFFVGAAQFMLVVLIADALYPGFSVSTYALSNLGTGRTALLASAWIAACGATLLFVSLLGRRVLGTGLATTLALVGICVMGVGLFPVRTSAPHWDFAMAAYVFAAIAAIVSYRLLRPPLAHFAVGLGIVALLAIILFVTGHDLGIGVGGMERMIAYLILIWALGFGAALIGTHSPTSGSRNASSR